MAEPNVDYVPNFTFRDPDVRVPQLQKVENITNTVTVDTNHTSQTLKLKPSAYREAKHDQFTALSGALLGAAHSVSPIPIAGTTLGGGVAAGGLGALNVQDIILTIERPIRYQPYDYSKLIGYPTDKAVKLGSIEGFAVIDKCHLRCEATLKEQELILEHFRQGVIF